MMIKESSIWAVIYVVFIGTFLWLATFLGSLVLQTSMRFLKMRKKASNIPGPPAVPIFGNALTLIGVANHDLRRLADFYKVQYPEIFRLWLGPRLFVLINKPEYVETCLKSEYLQWKSMDYEFVEDLLGKGLLTTSGDVWKRKRRILSTAFRNSALKDFVDTFNRHAKTLIQRLDEKVNQDFNVAPYLSKCTIDIISETASEKSIGAQTGETKDIISAVESCTRAIFYRIFQIWLQPNFMLYLTKFGVTYRNLLHEVKMVMNGWLLNSRQKIAEKPPDDCGASPKSFLRLLLDIKEKEETFQDEEIQAEFRTILFTGYDTTASTLTALMMMLGIHQDVQEKLYSEVQAMEEHLNGSEITADCLREFKYMDRVIKETLRLWPTIPLMARKATGDINLGERTCGSDSLILPEGSTVVINVWTLHRNPGIWDKPDEFNPDNFLPEKIEKRHPFSFIPFSAGPRICIGMKYAELSMKVITYNILRHYRITTKNKMEDIVVSGELLLKLQGGITIRLEKRKNKI